MFYKYKNNIYKIIGAGKMKEPNTGNWLESVVYSPIISNSSNRLYTREYKDFFSKFEKIEDPIEILDHTTFPLLP